MTHCSGCRGELHPGRTTEFYILAEQLYLVVEIVPALVCRDCGAACTDEETTDSLIWLVQRVRDSVPKGRRATLTYDYSTAKQLLKTA